MDTLDGILTRVLYHASGKFSPSGAKYLIAKLHTGQVVKGECSKPREGENYRFYGNWQESRNPGEGPAFSFEAYEPIVERSEAGAAQYLASFVDGLGRVKAAALVEAFGVDTLDILRTDPDRAISVPGITPLVVESIRAHFEEDCSIDPAAYAKLIDLFAGHRVPKRIVLKLLEAFRSSAPDKVRENPYLLLDFPRMGWETVDSIALTSCQYARDGIERHRASLVEALTQIANDGHTFGNKAEIEAIAFPLLGMRPRADAWTSATQAGDLVAFEPEDEAERAREGTCYALPQHYAAERAIAERLADLAATAKPLEFEIDTEGLKGEQVEAAKLIEREGVAVLAGAPGTGKSFTIAKVVESCLSHGLAGIRVACPTGKAAKRAAELLAQHGIDSDQVPSTTIHRMLGPVPSAAPEGVPSAEAKINRGRDEFGFSHNADNPLNVDLVIIDESSMVDISLMASTLDAIPNGTRVIFVGDQNQLPSVGPGSVLRDMLSSPAGSADSGIPGAYLTEIRRSQPGRVVRACHAIKDGRIPEPAGRVDLSEGVNDNWVHIELDDPHAIAAQIVDLHRPGQRFTDPVWDMQVVTPQKTRLPIACDNLNRLLSAKLNPLPVSAAQAGGLGGAGNGTSGDDEPGRTPPFRIGDKVVRTKNGLCDLMTPIGPGPSCDSDGFDWVSGLHAFEDDSRHVDWEWKDRAWSLSEIDVVNGDMGRVEDIVTGKKDVYVVVRFRNPERLCRLSYGKCELIAAYAMTCHRCQGSGFPYVIVPVSHSFYWDSREHKGIFSREWLYTAVSRAEVLLVTVGQFDAIRAAVGRKTVHRRKTRLASLLAATQPAGIGEAAR